MRQPWALLTESDPPTTASLSVRCEITALHRTCVVCITNTYKNRQKRLKTGPVFQGPLFTFETFYNKISLSFGGFFWLLVLGGLFVWGGGFLFFWKESLTWDPFLEWKLYVLKTKSHEWKRHDILHIFCCSTSEPSDFISESWFGHNTGETWLLFKTRLFIKTLYNYINVSQFSYTYPLIDQFYKLIEVEFGPYI